jgi:DNA-binding IclR family transcriptional regulator
MTTSVPHSKQPPPYAVASVDHALRIAVMLQVEGAFTVTQAAERLGVARSTAHRLLAMLVYRDFAVQDVTRAYCPGPVLQLAVHSRSRTSQLRATALPHMARLVDLFDESVNLAILFSDTTRFIASVECGQALRVGSREGMVFPAHRTTAGLLLLAEMSSNDLDSVFAEERYVDRPHDRPDLAVLRRELAAIRRNGFAVNRGRSEKGVAAVGVSVRDAGDRAVAGLAFSMPSVRYDRHRLSAMVTALNATSSAISHDLAEVPH